MSINEIKVFKPFGPSIVKVVIPENLLSILNNYIDETIMDEKKIKKLDHGFKLAGNVQQEFQLEEEFVKSSGLFRNPLNPKLFVHNNRGDQGFFL